MDIKEHIRYWTNSSREDLDAAWSLLEKKHLRHCVFFAHLSLEKAIKAHVAQKTQQVPPKIHNLIRLAEIAGIVLDEKRTDFLREFGVYQLEGRYPDSEQIPLNEAFVRSELDNVKEMIEWLIRPL